MTQIPSPLPYLSSIPDQRQDNSTYDWETLFLMVFLALGSGCKNVLHIAQWIEDHHTWLLRQGLKTRTGRNKTPRQASIYRFFWNLEQRITEFEAAFTQWAIAVIKVIATDKNQLLSFNTDGKHLRGTKRKAQKERAVLLVSSFIEQLGLSLCQEKCDGDEAKQAHQFVMQFGNLLPEVKWCLTGDAALTEQAVVKGVLKKRELTT